MSELLAALAPVDNAVVVVRRHGTSVHVCGRFQLTVDGDTPHVLQMADCECRVYVDWSQVERFLYREDDLGYGSAPTIVLLDGAGREQVSIHYPPATRRQLIRILRSLD